MMRNGLIMESALSVREKLFSIRILWATTPLLRIIVCKARNIVQEIDRVLDWNINNYALRIFVYHSPRVFHSFDESTSLCKDVSRLFYNILQKSEKKEEDFKEWRKETMKYTIERKMTALIEKIVISIVSVLNLKHHVSEITRNEVY